MAIQLKLPWPPSVNHYYRHVGNKILISREGRKYRQKIKRFVIENNVSELKGTLEMVVDAYPPDRRRRDLDNIQKCLWDSLQKAGVYEDDSQIKKYSAEMFAAEKPGFVIVTIRERV